MDFNTFISLVLIFILILNTFVDFYIFNAFNKIFNVSDPYVLLKKLRHFDPLEQKNV